MPVRRGLLVSFEGGEGAGKSTVIAAAARFLAARGERVVCLREPGGTPLGEALRGLLLEGRGEAIAPEAELLLMFASRAQLLRERLRPALAEGAVVLCDRFTDASFAYQGGGRGLPLEWIAELERRVVGLKPDLTLLLDLPPERSAERLAGRPLDRIEREGHEFFARVRGVYRERAAREPERFRMIDAGAAPAAVTAAVEAALLELLGRCR
ncbi:MAG: dTMP kinase [Xanthomonadales bacterium]|nr:dTMP kinase [Xanthomonadales bacterium]